MIRNYFKIAWRNLLADRRFSIINIVGLAIGLTITLLLFLFVSHEYSFDTMHTKRDNIYRVLLNTSGDQGNETWAEVPAALGPKLVEDIPEFTQAARMLKHNFGESAFIKAADQQFLENNLYWCDSGLFEIFDIQFLEGSKTAVFENPNAVVLSKSTADKFFGNGPVLGQMITVDNNRTLEVTGVYEDFPNNSTLDAGMIASFKASNFYQNPRWDNASFATYGLVNDKIDPSKIEIKLQALLDRYIKKENQWFTFSLQPLEKVHLYSANFDDNYSQRNGDIKEVQNLMLLAFLILIIACINYMNLTTARSQKRNKEVGISKTLGASTKSLILRFYTETGLITGIAILLGIGIAVLCLPYFNDLTNRSMKIAEVSSFGFLGLILLIWVVTTLIAGSYPALYLSGFSPKEIMEPTSKNGGMAVFVRKGLVVVQFAASIILIISVAVMYQQMQFIQNKDLGFNPSQVVAITATVAVENNTEVALLEKLKQNPAVIDATLVQGYPSLGVSGRTIFRNDQDKAGMDIQTNRADGGITEVLKLHLIAGQSLPKIKQEGDSLVDVLLNKKAVEYLGFTPEEAIGKKLEANLGNNAYVRGVVDNFNFTSLRTPIGGYAFHNRKVDEYYNYVLVRFDTSDIPLALKTFESDFKEIVPNSVFDYSFMDKNMERLYEAEKRTASIGLIFSALAIFIACLGLFGLVAFTAEQRNKEIGIRKVLGATVMNITRLLSVDFIKLVAIALLIAFPLAYFLMGSWLQGFAYRIDIGWMPFLLTGISAISIALITVSLQSIKAALSNPIEALRRE